MGPTTDSGMSQTEAEPVDEKKLNVNEDPHLLIEQRQQVFWAKKPKLYICSIYRRDFLTFLTHRKLQEMCLVSASYYTTVMRFPALLQARPKFNSFNIYYFPFFPGCTVYDEDGYSKFRGYNYWQTLPEFSDCCKNIEAGSSKLVGQRVFLNREATDSVHLTCGIMNRQSNIEMVVRNELTPTTAFSVVHMLDHLRGCFFEYFSHRHIDRDGGLDAVGVLNPALIAVLSALEDEPYMVYTRNETVWWAPSLLNNNLPRFAMVDSLHYHSSRSREDRLDPEVRSFIANGRHHAKKMYYRMEAIVGGDFIDSIIEFYTCELVNLRLVLSEVFFEFSRPATRWPKRCQQGAAIRRRRMLSDIFVYQFTNIHSSQSFTVSLVGGGVPRKQDGGSGDALLFIKQVRVRIVQLL